ncbi:MAG: FAD-dependent oxidoreductase [Clostridia bacterium]|nr:FAD-dependent oxidoreductase [Clostridia bacterium]
MRYVIIGNGTAAIACIEGIRSVDTEGDITLISTESRHCYGRPLISYYLLGRVDEAHLDYRPRDFYIKNNVDAMLGVTATAIDPEGKSVTLEDGTKVPYDKLLIATGSRPFVPHADGYETVENKFTFMTYDDMKALEAKLTPEARVLVVGAGLIGLKCVEGILDRVKEVTVVDLADRIMPSVLDAEGAAMVKKVLDKKGVTFYLSDCVSAYKDNTAILRSGREIPFDIVVTAVGVRPNTDLAKGAGCDVNRGVIIDEHCETSVKDIYCAGDCSEGYDKSINAKRILALLPNASFQGRCAGINMAGGDEKFTNAIPMNAMGFFGCHELSAGAYDGECISRITEDTYKKLYVKNGKLIGFILINDFERAGIYTSLIRDEVPLDTVDFDLLIDKPQLLAFSADARKAKLARKV